MTQRRTRDLGWLTARPIAHRGLHARASGVIENTPSAVAAALAKHFAIEIDVQATADGEAVVFHDFTLDRLTEDAGPVATRTLASLREVSLRDTSDRFWTLDECIDHVGGRQALVVEIKSSGDMGFARHVVERVAARGGPVAIKSFDPRVVATARRHRPEVPRGIIGEAFAAGDEHDSSLLARFAARNMAHWPVTRPDFVSWHVEDLDRIAVRLARSCGVPVMSWTVRTPEQQARAAVYADQMVFEGFTPD